MSKTATAPEDMGREALEAYIKGRLWANNYSEADRAREILARKLAKVEA